MTTETLTSFHVFICSNLRIFVNRLVTQPSQHMSDDLSHLQGCSAAALRQCHFGYALKYASLSTFSTKNSGE